VATRRKTLGGALHDPHRRADDWPWWRRLDQQRQSRLATLSANRSGQRKTSSGGPRSGRGSWSPFACGATCLLLEPRMKRYRQSLSAFDRAHWCGALADGNHRRRILHHTPRIHTLREPPALRCPSRVRGASPCKKRSGHAIDFDGGSDWQTQGGGVSCRSMIWFFACCHDRSVIVVGRQSRGNLYRLGDTSFWRRSIANGRSCVGVSGQMYSVSARRSSDASPAGPTASERQRMRGVIRSCYPQQNWTCNGPPIGPLGKPSAFDRNLR